jgi:hypothetical protein
LRYSMATCIVQHEWQLARINVLESFYIDIPQNWTQKPQRTTWFGFGKVVQCRVSHILQVIFNDWFGVTNVGFYT